MAVFVPIAGLATVLLLLGAWGCRNLPALAFVPGMPADRLARRERSMRRGARACRLIGVVFLLVAAASLVFPPVTGSVS